MGEAETGPLQLQFDRSIKLAFCGSSISSDGGQLLNRELDDALGLSDMAAGLIGDQRTEKNGRHHLAGFLRQSVFSRLAAGTSGSIGRNEFSFVRLNQPKLRLGDFFSARSPGSLQPRRLKPKKPVLCSAYSARVGEHLVGERF